MTIEMAPILIGGLFILVGLYGCFKKHDAKYGKSNYAGAALLVVGIGISFMAAPESSIEKSTAADLTTLSVVSAQALGSPPSERDVSEPVSPNASNNVTPNGVNNLLPEYAGKTYRIKSTTSDMYLYDNGLGDRLDSLENINNSTFLNFSFEYQLEDKSYRIKSRGSGRYLRATVPAEILVDAADQSKEDFSRFYIEKFSGGSVRLIVKAGQFPIGLDPMEGFVIISKVESQGEDNSHMQLELVVENNQP